MVSWSLTKILPPNAGQQQNDTDSMGEIGDCADERSLEVTNCLVKASFKAYHSDEMYIARTSVQA
jgi:hypothetical protein